MGLRAVCVLATVALLVVSGSGASIDTSARQISRASYAGVTIVAIAAGDFHTCALTNGGGVKCWGYNDSGQLGNGSRSAEAPSPVPGDVVGLSSGVSAIAAGSAHTCALTNMGGAKCWGANHTVFSSNFGLGQLGDGTTLDRFTPVDVSGLASGVSAITAGGHHTCALRSGGVLCWGGNFVGQVADGTTTNRYTPTAVSGLSSGVSQIVAGGHHNCALTSAGGVKCWGENTAGQLGDGGGGASCPSGPAVVPCRRTPVDVSGLPSGVSAIAAGGHHADSGGTTTCALMSTGGVKCWGDNSYSQVGDGTTGGARSTPVDVSGFSGGVKSLAVGDAHVCALTSAGGVKCWGHNDSGQLGDGTTTDRSTPVDVSGLASGVSAIAAGSYHTCAVLSGGELKCWGGNHYGQLGDGTTTNRLTPVTVVWEAQAMCVVPNVKGKTLAAAQSAIAEAKCQTGTIQRAFSTKVKRSRVISQKPGPDTRLAEGGKVNLVVSRGRKRH